MKLFILEMGNTTAYAAAESLEEMHKRKAEVDNTFAYLPVEITEFVLEGYEITVAPVEPAEGETAPRRGGRPKKLV